jgi:hypothetical protein
MEEAFNTEEFVAKMKLGKFEGRLAAELKKLSAEELEEVVDLMVAERLMKRLQSDPISPAPRTTWLPTESGR